ncbi:beta-1,6-N-acetylglucosaminyltransferase [Neobacillus sp. OS1-32]|jgi:hypothetical protein|uniref:beta-1,6-N-acetylglucosaminyltransferase n=1 Tax=Neobacillus sp. OS1-32 TaxID=3070682 RepID=UPI0027DEBCC0|nr:beta-1,6-N-acetylglucosaminyltransferase [Neobacillus sp. OS1-32]WML30320.1 beta-1,6-N-acetylglucosaminyltransferase [Neobacillus sp. OS1-32]
MKSKSLRTAFIFQIHKNPNQVNQFIHQITSSGEADVFIHIDKKNFESMAGKIVRGENIYILHQSVSCEWGDISQIDATLLLLQEVINSHNEYDYVCLRSGQDLLVKNGFKEFLKDQNGKIFMSYRQLNRDSLGLMKINWPKATRKRYTTPHPIRVYRRILLSLYAKGINVYPNYHKWPKEFSFYKGSQWFTIPFEVAKYMIDYLNENEWYYQFFQNTLVPDESFFHTLILNSPYKSRVVNNHLFYLKWGESLSDRNSPQDLTFEDHKLIDESNLYFARKFDETIDKSVIEYYVKNIRFGGKSKISI